MGTSPASASAPKARSPKIKDFVPLAGLDDGLHRLGHLSRTTCTPPPEGRRARPRAADRSSRSSIHQADARPSSTSNYVKRLDGPNVKKGKNKMELAEQVRDDIRDFKKTTATAW